MRVNASGEGVAYVSVGDIIPPGAGKVGLGGYCWGWGEKLWDRLSGDALSGLED